MTRLGRTWIAAALIAGPAVAQSASEHLAPPPSPGFRLGFSTSGLSAMQEYLPAGESLQRWTRMITLQRYGYRPGLTPTRFAEAWLAGLARACSVTAPQAVATTVDGHAAADARFDCPLNPQTGKPETVMARIILGDEALYVVQVATRRAPNPDDLNWMRQVVTATRRCSAADTTPRCAATADPKLGSAL